MKILFIRHGQTNLNNPKRMQGISNSELNEVGKEQAKEAKKELDNKNIDLIISSPLIRAIQTAEIINKDKNAQMIIDERICEINFGDIEGNLYSDDYLNMNITTKFNNGESFEEFFNRIYNFLDELKIKYNDKKILIVAHGCVARAFRCYFDGVPEDRNIANYGIENCAIVTFEYEV